MVAALVLLAALAGSPSDPAPRAPPPGGPPAQPTPAPAPTPTSTPDAQPPGEDEAADFGVFDRSHAFISQRLVEGVAWFDELFADERNADFQRRGSAARWQNELRFEAGGAVKPRSGLRLDLQVPELEGWFQQLRFIVYAENVTNDALLVPEDPTNPLAAGPANQTRAAGELRYQVIRALQNNVDVGIGVRAEVPPGVFLRARYRSSLDVGLGALARFTASTFYDSTLRLGTSAEATAERPFSRRFLLRFTNLATLSESRSARGVEWASEAGAIWAPAQSRAWGVGLSAAGVTRPAAQVTAYRIAVRHRHVLWRRWLFVEVEPDLTWRRDEATGVLQSVPGIAFRVEVNFDAARAAAR